MVGQLHHRGPDDGGVVVLDGGRVVLGNRRLAIRDLSERGHMPMSSPGSDTWITYNGEIYNAAVLRDELKQGGWEFRSTSDTEVILQGYRAWGPAVVERLRGMFAFAICDPDGGVFLARDRLGIKPLFYSHRPGEFYFASEAQPLVRTGRIPTGFDAESAIAFLAFGSTPAPGTIYESIRALEPGSSLILQPGDTEPARQRYWSPPTTIDRSPRSRPEVVADVRDLLQESVRVRLVSDVPLGAFLSGGIDSSAVVLLMREMTSGPLRTCSIAFDESEYSEASYARMIAERVGSEHFERTVTSDDLVDSIDQIFSSMDLPTMDGINTYFVSETARQAGLTVAMSGLGGDELFGGYSTFRQVPRLVGAISAVRAIPGGRHMAAQLTRVLPRPGRWSRVRDALRHPATRSNAYVASRGVFALEDIRSLVTPEFWAEAAPGIQLAEIVDSAVGSEEGPLHSWISRAELSRYMHDQLLRDTDVMSMAHSLEVRVPLLDHHLVEYMLRLPPALKGGSGTKPLLVSAVDDLIPEQVWNRRKMGFTFPFAKWLRGPLRGFLRESLASAGTNGVFRPAAVDRLLDDFNAGRVHWSRPWTVCVLLRQGVGG